MATIKNLLETSNEFEHKCLFCGYNEYEICLTAHHIFPKEFFRPQPKFKQTYRYIVLCPTCHTLVHRGIYVNNGRELILEILDKCAKDYANRKDIDNIIRIAKLIYAKPKEPEHLNTTSCSL